MNTDRSWMYQRTVNGSVLPSFVEGVDAFVAYALSQTSCLNGGMMRCPCNQYKCRNKQFLPAETVVEHLKRKGFVPEYFIWNCHGEAYKPFMDYEQLGKRKRKEKIVIGSNTKNTSSGDANNYDHGRGVEQMVRDMAGPEFMDTREPVNDGGTVEEPPNPEDKLFFDMMESARKPVYPGCKHTELSMMARLMNCKTNGQQSESNFNEWVKFMSDMCPEESQIPKNFYQVKKKMRAMGLPMETIDCCEDMCMIYWEDDKSLLECKFCGKDRYKRYKEGASKKRQKKNLPHKKMWYFPLAPRLKRLYQSSVCADKMRWHKEREIPEKGTMVHPSDSPAWKHFDKTYPEFASEPRNVRLGLCTDGFNPFGNDRRYSCWPVMLTPYNLPPGECMKEPFMFLTCLVPGPTDPGQKIDVFLQPLIKDLIELWEKGIPAYDVSTKTNFTLRAALLWTVSDFPAYSMLSGRKTAGFNACPHCLDNHSAFRLKESGKECWFDHRRFIPAMDHAFRKSKTLFLKGRVEMRGPPEKLTGQQILLEIDRLGLMKVTELGSEKHNEKISKNCGWKKRSIFWDLPYWSTLLIRHNLDFMHIEKNVFENCFNTICNIKGKTKDNEKSRAELGTFCNRPELTKQNDKGMWPKAVYTIDIQARNKLFEWVTKLKFPDGYASNLGGCVDLKKTKIFGMKSHDCHVFMERLVPVAFRELLPKPVWSALTDLSLFFKNLCSRVLEDEVLANLESNIPIILCNLERIFPPSFFDSMEHLPVHLPHEARLAGPVQYRWMYPFERYLGTLKKYVSNKGKPEGSIANAYVRQECAYFCSYYFGDDVPTKASRQSRNADTYEVQEDDEDTLSIFRVSGRPMGVEKTKWLTDEEVKAAHYYVLSNCAEVDEYMKIFTM